MTHPNLEAAVGEIESLVANRQQGADTVDMHLGKQVGALEARDILRKHLDAVEKPAAPATTGDGLLPCPFCGCRAEIDADGETQVVIECCNGACDINPSVMFDYEDDQDTLAAAIEAWNTRAPRASKENP